MKLKRYIHQTITEALKTKDIKLLLEKWMNKFFISFAIIYEKKRELALSKQYKIHRVSAFGNALEVRIKSLKYRVENIIIFYHYDIKLFSVLDIITMNYYNMNINLFKSAIDVCTTYDEFITLCKEYGERD